MKRSEQTVYSTLRGACSEAVSETGFTRAFLVLLVAFMIVPFAPFWVMLALIERAGYFDLDRGFHL